MYTHKCTVYECFCCNGIYVMLEDHQCDAILGDCLRKYLLASCKAKKKKEKIIGVNIVYFVCCLCWWQMYCVNKKYSLLTHSLTGLKIKNWNPGLISSQWILMSLAGKEIERYNRVKNWKVPVVQWRFKCMKLGWNEKICRSTSKYSASWENAQGLVILRTQLFAEWDTCSGPRVSHCQVKCHSSCLHLAFSLQPLSKVVH